MFLFNCYVTQKDVKCFTKLNLAIFKDLGEVVVKLPNI